MDRNYYADKDADWVRVALRKESVDRNDNGNAVALSDLESLSARRAWIEIGILPHHARKIVVALRKESVDRNLSFHNSIRRLLVALRKESVDRNFDMFVLACCSAMVALRKESVDRNLSISKVWEAR